MTEQRLTIGALAAGTACSVPTIRYYEQIGLLPRPERAANGHRYYRPQDLRRLGFIKRCRDFGFPIDQVRELASLFEDGKRACVEVRDLARGHLDEVRRKLDEMRQLEKNLEAFVSGCDAACSGGPTKHCVILEDMSPQGGATLSCGSSSAIGMPDGPLRAREIRRG
jgi:DNA-binding transcriptional MerR regulator